MDPQKIEKLVGMFKHAIAYEEFNLVEAQRVGLLRWRKDFPKHSRTKREGEKILNKLILDSLNHALVFANLIIKIYEEKLRQDRTVVKD